MMWERGREGERGRVEEEEVAGSDPNDTAMSDQVRSLLVVSLVREEEVQSSRQRRREEKVSPGKSVNCNGRWDPGVAVELIHGHGPRYKIQEKNSRGCHAGGSPGGLQWRGL